MYSYSVEGNTEKNFISDGLLAKEREVFPFEGLRLYVVVVDGEHVHCVDSEFPKDEIEHKALKTRYFDEADYLETINY